MKKLSWFSGVGTRVAQEVPSRASPISAEVAKSFMNSLLLDLPKLNLSRSMPGASRTAAANRARQDYPLGCAPGAGGATCCTVGDGAPSGAASALPVNSTTASARFTLKLTRSPSFVCFKNS